MSEVPYAVYTAEGNELSNGLDALTARKVALEACRERNEPIDVYQGSRLVVTMFPHPLDQIFCQKETP